MGLDSVISLCLKEPSENSAYILEKLMALLFCHMHGPEHHAMVGAALLTAYHDSGGDIELKASLSEMLNRGKCVPGGACGYWGACGAGISAGMFVSIISQSTPLTEEPFALSRMMCANALGGIGEIGSSRCYKFDSYISALTATDFVAQRFGVMMEKPHITCFHSKKNRQRIGRRCHFWPKNRNTLLNKSFFFSKISDKSMKKT